MFLTQGSIFVAIMVAAVGVLAFLVLCASLMGSHG